MRSLTIREVRAVLPELEQLLREEGECVITRRGQPIARLLPAGPRRAVPSHADLRSQMPRLEVGSEVLIREDRDAR
jgi:antitoxin (DNA-binding transcriptional repressor) of toxin-antitoxin stability system